MRFFSRRRLTYSMAALVLAVILYVLWRMLWVSLRPAAVYSGFVLLVLVLGLAVFNGRKKLPFLPLWKVSTWMQVHIYAGWLSVVVFALHTGLRIPSGVLEGILAGLFIVVALSGVAGVFISRLLPPAITKSGESLVYARIPRYLRELRGEVESIVEQAERETRSPALGTFYLETLAPYFQQLSGVPLLAGDPTRHARRVLFRMNEFCRYLNDDERRVIDVLGEYVERKRNIDFQYSAQRLLKLWLFIHIPFTYSLIIVSLVHAWVALAYSGSL